MKRIIILLLVLPSLLALQGCAMTFSKKVQKTTAIEKTFDQPDWYVVNNFRLMDGEAEEQRFFRDLSMYYEELWEWSDKEKDVGSKINLFFPDLVHARFGETRQNYKTHYDNRRYSYNYRTTDIGRPKWSVDPRRQIRLVWPNAPDGMCRWELLNNEGETLDEKLSPCRQVSRLEEGICPEERPFCVRQNLSCPDNGNSCFEIERDKTYSARVVSQSNQLEISFEKIQVEDKLIVAMGDSFSAGEGNPHMQYRIIPTRARPTYFWDDRCHRSLLSGPALAAAIYSRKNRKKSVSFLHYGCSGASVDDGLVHPWRLLETSEQQKKRHDFFWWKLFGYDGPPETQKSPCVSGGTETAPYIRFIEPSCTQSAEGVGLGADILPSQIDMASHDLNPNSRYPGDMDAGMGRRPDYVFISIGGNDVGFADLVMALSVRSENEPTIMRKFDGRYFRAEKSTDEARFELLASEVEHILNEPAGDCGSVLDPPRDLRQSENQDDLRCFYRDRKRQFLNSYLQKYSAIFSIGMYRIDHTIPEQYKLVQSATNQRLDPRKVIVTRYPSALTYRESTMTKEQPCSDHAFDGRPDFTPTTRFFTIRLFGIENSTSELASEYILERLNTRIAEQIEDDPDWHMTTEESFKATKPFGYCSLAGRMFNTVGLASFVQGFAPSGLTPIGSLEIADSQNREFARWDVARSCYVKSGGSLSGLSLNCLSEDELSDPKRFRYTHSFADVNEPEKSKPKKGGVVPKGAFHPTPLGHCMYALAILEKMGQLEGGKIPPLRIKGNEHPEKAALQELCSAETFGFEVLD